jgi:hypothetical protein
VEDKFLSDSIVSKKEKYLSQVMNILDSLRVVSRNADSVARVGVK